MESRRSLAWRLSWYRQSELEGALLLGRMVRQANNRRLVAHLTRHCADEARHALIWERTLTRLDLPAVRIFRSYQSFYLEETSPPRTLEEVLALTHVFEQRVDRRFAEELRRPDLPGPMRRALEIMLRDEQDHLAWVADWLAGRPGRDALLDRFRQADERVHARLAPAVDRLLEVPGLGQEIPHDAKRGAARVTG
jgi:hypothetical protein